WRGLIIYKLIFKLFILNQISGAKLVMKFE
ncbi:MAG: hypothetical protein RLZZ209_941, partial [Bacteroidota bacterium]